MNKESGGRGEPLLVLVPSPLVGPSTWNPLRKELALRGQETVVSIDVSASAGALPHWERTVAGAERALREVPEDRPVVLVGHSGAGPLLPAAAARISQRVMGYLFVDAGLPSDGVSRLDAISANGPEGAAFASDLSSLLEAGRRYPEWTDAELAPLIPDEQRRQQLLAELRPRGRDFWTEPLPKVTDWPDRPCAYLWFSEPYKSAAQRAEGMGWPVRHLPAGHFHHLVDEATVSDALLALWAAIRSS
jgi:pimeloyl-ACP methyl ester carboxylesterase